MKLTDSLRLIDLLLLYLWVMDDDSPRRGEVIATLRIVSQHALDTWGELKPRETVNDIPF